MRSLGERAALYAVKTAASWHDLSPLVRRALIGSGIGAASGAVAGAVASDEGHRLRGGLLGGLGGGVLGGLGGAAYNKMKPIVPLTMPGRYEASIGAMSKGLTQDFTSVFPRSEGGGLAQDNGGFRWQHRDTPADATGALPVYDKSQRPIGVVPQVRPVDPIKHQFDHLHLTPTSQAEIFQDHELRDRVVKGVSKQYRPEHDVTPDYRSMSHEAFMDRPSIWKGEEFDPNKAPRRNVTLEYRDALSHDSRESPEMNEMRRLLRLDSAHAAAVKQRAQVAVAEREALINAHKQGSLGSKAASWAVG